MPFTQQGWSCELETGPEKQKEMNTEGLLQAELVNIYFI